MMRSIQITETLYHYHRRKSTFQCLLYFAKTSILPKYRIASLQLSSASAAHSSEYKGEHGRTQVKYINIFLSGNIYSTKAYPTLKIKQWALFEKYILFAYIDHYKFCRTKRPI